jgi:hypothetical protein
MLKTERRNKNPPQQLKKLSSQELQKVLEHAESKKWERALERYKAGETVPVIVIVGVGEDEKALKAEALKERGLSSEREAFFIIWRVHEVTKPEDYWPAPLQQTDAAPDIPPPQPQRVPLSNRDAESPVVKTPQNHPATGSGFLSHDGHDHASADYDVTRDIRSGFKDYPLELLYADYLRTRPLP